MATYAQIRAQQQQYWVDYIQYRTYVIAPHYRNGVNPTVNEDFDHGYRKGQLWLNVATNVTYICEDTAVGAAVWNTLSGGGGGPETDPLALLKANNLFDLTNVSTARTNLGLGSGNSPTFAGMALTGFNGIVKASLGILSAAPLLEAELPTGINANKIASGIVSNTEFDYLDGLTGNIQTQINNLGGTYVRSTRFASIGAGTGGTVTLPPGATVVLDDFGGTVDAVVTQISGGRPISEHARDAGGNIVTTTFDGSGNWVFSSTPVSYPVALIYRVRQTASNFDGTAADIIGDYDVENITGPASSTDSAIALWQGTDGSRVKNSVVTVDGSGNLSGVGTINGVTWQKFTYTIAATASDVNQVTCRSARYFVSVWSTVGIRSFYMIAARHSTSTTDSVFGRVREGTPPNAVTFLTSASGSDIVLTIQNNEAVSVTVEILREVLG